MVFDAQDALNELMAINQSLARRCADLALELGAARRQAEELAKQLPAPKE